MKALYFDCFSGASGDMIVGALLDAGASFDRLRKALDTLGVPGYTVSAEKILKRGISATQFRVVVDPNIPKPPRHLRHIIEIIEQGDLPAAVKSASAETFRRIAEAEAQVHNTTVEKIHFHEVGAIDAIVDVVGAHVALHDLGVERVEVSPLPVGGGTVTCDHGVLPVPAPATAILLKNVPTYGGDLEGEFVTPTGAALITQMAVRYGLMPAMTVEAVGYGSGTRDLADRANVLRVLVGQVAAPMPASETITVIETNVDDMSPELLPPLVADLLEAGARDAFLTPVLGKKGRPAHLITVLCDSVKASQMAALLFRGSTTLGIRIRTENRICLDRQWKTVKTPWGEVRIKIGRFEGRITVAAPEFEDCRRLAEEAGVAVLAVYEAAQAAALQLKKEPENG